MKCQAQIAAAAALSSTVKWLGPLGMSTPSLVWAVIVVSVCLWIAGALVSSKIKARRRNREARALLPEVHDHFRTGTTYRVLLTSGKVLEPVRFIGISKPQEGSPDFLPFPLQSWVILENANSKRIFLKANAIRMYEEL